MVITQKYELTNGVRQKIDVNSTSVTGCTILLYNETHGNHFCALGDETVTTATGVHLYGGENLTFHLEPGEFIYAIAGESIDLRVLAYNVD